MIRRWVIVGLLSAVAAASLAPAAAGAADMCAGRQSTIRGTAGNDKITGTPHVDVIVGFGGSDEIHGLGGADVICGGPGADLIFGGDGDDVLRGQGGDDTVAGGGGNDLVLGGDGADDLAGKSGDDQLSGGRGDDVVRGGTGDDLMKGRAGDDILIGGVDEDSLIGGGGVDTCEGDKVFGCELTPLTPGDQGDPVEHLQRALAAAELYRGQVSGLFEDETAAAVVAFHKLISDPLGDTWTVDDHVGASWTLDDWDRIGDFDPTVPKERPNYPTRIEVDIGRQVLYVVEDQAVTAIMPISSGGDYWYGNQQYAHTPRGRHEFYRYTPGWQSNGQYESWYFKSIFAVHGYRLVPPYPVSHGCVRVPVWDADWLKRRLDLGMSIFIWDE